MSTERPIDSKGEWASADLILTQTERSLRQFMVSHRIENRLLDELDGGYDTEHNRKLHKGGAESYRFGKHLGTRGGNELECAPIRQVSWLNDDHLYYLFQIYPDVKKQNRFKLWSAVSVDGTFNADRLGNFQEFVFIDLQMPKEDMDQVLENKFRLLTQEGANIKALTTSSPIPHHADQL